MRTFRNFRYYFRILHYGCRVNYGSNALKCFSVSLPGLTLAWNIINEPASYSPCPAKCLIQRCGTWTLVKAWSHGLATARRILVTYFFADTYKMQVAQAKCGKCEATEKGKNHKDQRDGGVCMADVRRMGGNCRWLPGGCWVDATQMFSDGADAMGKQSKHKAMKMCMQSKC